MPRSHYSSVFVALLLSSGVHSQNTLYGLTDCKYNITHFNFSIKTSYPATRSCNSLRIPSQKRHSWSRENNQFVIYELVLRHCRWQSNWRRGVPGRYFFRFGYGRNVQRYWPPQRHSEYSFSIRLVKHSQLSQRVSPKAHIPRECDGRLQGCRRREPSSFRILRSRIW